SCTPGVPIELLPLALAPAACELYFVLVNPVFEAPTAEMRAVLPKQVSMSAMINNCCQGGSLVAGVLTGDVRLIGRALDSDVIIEPVRGPLIPGLLAVKAAAKAAGKCWVRAAAASGALLTGS
ncbi:uncharacterized protein HaLaN_27948, partial [Haematococcus lacustris]